MKLRLFIVLLAVAALAACAPKDPTEAKIDALLRQMTLEEKIGQMTQVCGGWYSDDLANQVRQGAGSMLNSVGAEANYYQRIAVEETRLGIPMIFARDVIHGFRTIYPIPLGQAATFDPALVEQAAHLTAQEAKQAGLRWTFSPMVDVARDPRWGRIAEGYGEDTYLTAVMGAATVRGYQGKDYDPATGEGQIDLAACVKHFAGYSASESGRDYNTTWIPEVLLREVYLPPFKAAVDAGSATIMCAFNDLNGVPASANRHLNVDILRDEWGYNGMLVSDWASSANMIAHGNCENLREATVLSMNAQMEMDMEGHGYPWHLKSLVEEGRVSVKQIDACVRDILRLKFRLGLFDNPYCAVDTPQYYAPDALAAAQQAAEESAVLLKNNGVLPVGSGAGGKGGAVYRPHHEDTCCETNVRPGDRTSLKRLENRGRTSDSETVGQRTARSLSLFVCGPLADSQHDQNGTWCFDKVDSMTVTPLMAFREKAAQGEVRLLTPDTKTKPWSRQEMSEAEISRLCHQAKQADVILYFGGEESILSGEARCRAHLDLPGNQTEQLRALKATGKPVVLVIMAGRPLCIGQELEIADAVLYSFHGGTMAGPALARLLMGEAAPSGRLPVTFPQAEGQIPIYYNKKNTGRPTDHPVLIDQIPVGAPQFSLGESSYWLEYGDKPLLPFGYGLTYTTFTYSAPVLSDTLMSDEMTVSCVIRNTGERDGVAVPQLYVRDLVGSVTRPVRELKGFQRVSIPAGDSTTVTFTLTRDDLAYWHYADHITLGADGGYQRSAEPGRFQVWIAPDAADGTPAEFVLR
ncbi:MAG: glycoside hydrolase family 3 N-terminal domain-containing protein [Paludibacteraceae bacterium]|nr:glycoside hydrolase family 3 N-terminal domain-containing protein [Paludibacteraceae bacterium]